MPQSPGPTTRAATECTKVSGADAGRIPGKQVEPIVQPLKPTGPVSPRVPGHRTKRERRAALRAEVKLRHQVHLNLVAPGRYQAVCSCGGWSAEVPAQKGRRGHLGEFQLHIDREVQQELARRQGDHR
jgi:hypothetical protein